MDTGLHDEQLRDGRIVHRGRDAVEPPLAAVLRHGDPALGESEVKAFVRHEWRQQALALRGRHRALEPAGERRRVREHRGDVRIAHRELLGDDATGEGVRAGAAGRLRQRQRAQPQPRRRLELRREQRLGEGLQALGPERDGFHLARDEIPDRVADLELLGAEMQVEHWPIRP